MGSNKNREISIDMLRVAAIILMIWSHVVTFINSNESHYIYQIKKLADIVCFTTFLFLSGISIIFVLSKTKGNLDKKKYLSRIIKLIAGYYLVAIIAQIKSGLNLKLILETLLLMKVPPYTEFILPFIIYSFLIYLIPRKLLKKFFISKHFEIILLILGIAAYTFGTIIYKFPLENGFKYYQAILSGYPGFLRFPILQYLPVFLFGIILGKTLLQKSKPTKILGLASLISIIIFFIVKTSDTLYSFPYNEFLQRWPPNLSFLLAGIIFCLLGLLTLKIIIFQFKHKLPGCIEKTSGLISKQTFNIFILHTIFLHLYTIFYDKKIESLFILILIFISLFFISATTIPFLQLLKNKVKLFK